MKTGVLLSANTNLALMDESGILVIPDSVTAIGEGAFADLSGLKTIIIPGTVKEIRQNAFRNNADLEHVILQEGVESIGNSAFNGCSNIKQVELPESLTIIQGSVFYECYNLQEISIPSNVTEIGDYAFYRCYNLQKVELKQGLQSIGEAAFNLCSSIKEINIPEGVTAINGLTFSDCSSLEYIYIPKSVTRIVNNAFSGCINLYEIDISTQSESYKYDDASGILTNMEGTTIVFMSGRVLQSLDELSIPQGITSFQTSISSYSNITKIVIPESLTALGNANLFPTTISDVEIQGNNNYFAVENNCLYNKEKTRLIMCFTKGETVQLADTLIEVPSYSFKQAVNLRDVVFPDSVTTLGNTLNFSNTVQNVTLGAKVSSIHPLFRNLYSDITLTIDSLNPYYSVEDNVLYNKDKTELITAVYHINGNFTVRDTVEVIGSQAFRAQVNMSGITWPEGLKEIGDNVFMYCEKITSIYVPNSVEKISSGAFGASGIREIKIDKAPGTIEGAPWGATIGDRAIEWLRD